MRIRKAWRSFVSIALLCIISIMTSCITLHIKETSEQSSDDWKSVYNTASPDENSPDNSAADTSATVETIVTEAEAIAGKDVSERDDELELKTDEEADSLPETVQTDDSSVIPDSKIQGLNGEENEGELDP